MPPIPYLCSMSHQSLAREVFAIEADAVRRLADSLTADFDHAIELLLHCTGRAVICGMGKSGIIGKKISATLASTGTPSFFLHPSEALHGDLGMLRVEDVFVSISNSGETDEILRIIPSIQRMNLRHIAIVGNPQSTLARAADAVLNVAIEREACPLQLAPMASTTATLAMGDALAAVLMEVKGFQPAQFAEFHPGGSLGRKLLVRVADEMIRTELPICAPDAEIQEVILRMTHGKMGLVVVCEDAQRVVGIITDGDLRRALGKVPQSAFFSLSAQQIMHTSPKTIAPTERAAAADDLMTAQKITALLVVDDARTLLGVYHRIH